MNARANRRRKARATKRIKQWRAERDRHHDAIVARVIADWVFHDFFAEVWGCKYERMSRMQRMREVSP